jgi:hypothetical protein
MFFTTELANAHIADLLAEAEQARRVKLASTPRVRRHRLWRHEAHTAPQAAATLETTVYCRRAAGHAWAHGGAR